MDISDRKTAEIALRQSEARFRNLFESNIVGMFFASIQGEILDANDRFLRMIGFTRQELDLGLVHWDRLTPSNTTKRIKKLLPVCGIMKPQSLGKRNITARMVVAFLCWSVLPV
ncbi:PAS domain S-box protein [Synechocystis sp. B12]|nr:PAS domain S-box protein [Synechocystis sp. B12]